MAKADNKYKISYKNFLGKLEKDSIPNIILLSLKEKILLDDIVKVICSKFVGKGFDPVNNLISFNADDKQTGNVLNECSNTGLFSDKKVVILKNVKKFSKDDKLSYTDYFKRPNPDTVLIMVSTADEFSPGKVFSYDSKLENENSAEIKKTVESSVKIYEIGGFTDEEFISWIKEKFGDYKVDTDAIVRMLQYSNHSSDEIMSEIEKLKTYCFFSKEVTMEAVNLCNGIAKDFKETDFIRAVIERDSEKALLIYEKISLKKDVEVYLIFLLNTAFVIINKLYDPGVSKLQGWQLKKELKLWPDEQEQLLPFYRKFRNSLEYGKMKYIFGNIYQSDKLLKSSGRDKKSIMTGLINNICGS